MSEYNKEFKTFNIYVLEEICIEKPNDEMVDSKENVTEEKSYALFLVEGRKDEDQTLFDYINYDKPNIVIDNMANEISRGTAPVGVSIVSIPRPDLYEGKRLPKRLKDLEYSIVGYVDLDSEKDSEGVCRALSEDEMRFFVSGLKKKLNYE